MDISGSSPFDRPLCSTDSLAINNQGWLKLPQVIMPSFFQAHLGMVLANRLPSRK